MKASKFRVLVLGVLTLSLLMLPACSKTEWAVRWGDSLLAWKINRQFDFNGSAKKTVRTETRDLLHWAREKKFPKLSQDFKVAAQEFSSLPLSSEGDVRDWVSSKVQLAESYLRSLPLELEPFVAKIASEVDKDNWDAFQKNFENENAKLLKEKPQCREKMRSELEDWLGSLTSKQLESVEKYCDTRKGNLEVRVRNRQHLMEIFRSWAAAKSGSFDPQLFQAAVHKWLESYQEIQLPEAENRWKKSRAQLIQSLTQILMESSTEQRTHLQDRLQARSQSFQRLSL